MRLPSLCPLSLSSPPYPLSISLFLFSFLFEFPFLDSFSLSLFLYPQVFDPLILSLVLDRSRRCNEIKKREKALFRLHSYASSSSSRRPFKYWVYVKSPLQTCSPILSSLIHSFLSPFINSQFFSPQFSIPPKK